MSTATVNPGVSNLLQTLSNINSPVLSSPAVVSALEQAPACDIVQLSAEAMQVEGMDALFGMSDGSGGGAAGALQALASSAAGSASSSSSSSSASSATQAAGYQADLQAEEAQALLGGSSTASTGSLLDAIG